MSRPDRGSARFPLPALLLAILLPVLPASTGFADTNPEARYAIDLRSGSGPMNCAQYASSYRDCRDITPSLPATGEFRAIIVLYNFNWVSVAGLAIAWPADWEVDQFVSCGDITIGGTITGDTLGVAVSWGGNGRTSSGPAGIPVGILHGWATSPGTIRFVDGVPFFPVAIATPYGEEPLREVFGAAIGEPAPGDPCAYDSVLIANGVATSAVDGPAPLTVSFADRSWGAPTAWSWNFGDGGTSTERDPVHTYSGCGVYSVTHGASNATASDDTVLAAAITVRDPSEPSFTADYASGCAPIEIHFTDTSGGEATGWLWNFGDGGTSTERNPSHVYTRIDTFDVSLSVTRACPTITYTAPGFIQIAAYAPYEPITYDVVEGCAPFTVHFGSHTRTATAWLWDFGDGTTSTEQNPVHVFTEPRTYDVKLTETIQCGPWVEIRPSTHFFPALIDAGRFHAAMWTENNPFGCLDRPFEFHDLTAGTVLSRLWDFGDGTTSTESDPVHQYDHESPSEGFHVTLTVTTTCGVDSTWDELCVRGGPSCCYVATEFQGPTASASDEGILIQWEVPAAGGSAFTGYNVQRATSPAGPFVTVNARLITAPAAGSASSWEFLDTSASPGMPWYYRVQALLAGGGTAEYALANPIARTPGPDEFSRLILGAPGPVPSTGTVWFELGVPTGSGRLTLQVVDASGRRIRTLETADIGAGRHRLVWDAKDDAGRRVSPGIYFLRLESTTTALTRKIVIVE